MYEKGRQASVRGGERLGGKQCTDRREKDTIRRDGGDRMGRLSSAGTNID